MDWSISRSKADDLLFDDRHHRLKSFYRAYIGVDRGVNSLLFETEHLEARFDDTDVGFELFEICGESQNKLFMRVVDGGRDRRGTGGDEFGDKVVSCNKVGRCLKLSENFRGCSDPPAQLVQ